MKIFTGKIYFSTLGFCMTYSFSTRYMMCYAARANDTTFIFTPHVGAFYIKRVTKHHMPVWKKRECSTFSTKLTYIVVYKKYRGAALAAVFVFFIWDLLGKLRTQIKKFSTLHIKTYLTRVRY